MSWHSVNIVSAAVLLLAPAVRPQGPNRATSLPSFDAASVKRCPPGSPGFQFDPAKGRGGREHGRFTYRHVPLKYILGVAYHLPSDRVLGLAGMDSEFYDIAAVMPPETPDDQVLLMLQNLLKERFRLKVRLEDRETAVYALMGMLATALSIWMDRPVIDMTGLSGAYDLTLDWSAYQSPESADQVESPDGVPRRPDRVLDAVPAQVSPNPEHGR